MMISFVYLIIKGSTSSMPKQHLIEVKILLKLVVQPTEK